MSKHSKKELVIDDSELLDFFESDSEDETSKKKVKKKMTTKAELQAEIDGVVEKINDKHLPAGTPEGGQFAPKDGGSGDDRNIKLMAKRGKSLASFSDDELIENHIDAHSVVFIKQGFEKTRKALKPDPDIVGGIEQELINRGLLPKNTTQLRIRAKKALKSGGSVSFIGTGKKGSSGVIRQNAEGTFDVFQGRKLVGTFDKVDMNFILNINKIRSIKDVAEKMTTSKELQAGIDGVVDGINQKFNQNHEPAGSPKGGQFASSDGGGGGGGSSGKDKTGKKETGRSFGSGNKQVTISVDNDTGKDATRWLEVTFAKEPSKAVQLSLRNNLDRGNTEVRRQGDTFVMRFGANTQVSEARVNIVRQSLHRGGHIKIPGAFFDGDITKQESDNLFGVDIEIFRKDGRLKMLKMASKAELQQEIDGVVDEINEKFNPNHDPATGRFTTAGSGAVTIGKIKPQKDPLPFSDKPSVADTGKVDEYGRRVLRDEHGEFMVATSETQEFFDQTRTNIGNALRANGKEIIATREKIDALSIRIENFVVRKIRNAPGAGDVARRTAPKLRAQRRALRDRLPQLLKREDTLQAQRAKLQFAFQVESS